MSNQTIILTGHSFAEKIDELTQKIFCVTCGGKGFYLLVSFGTSKGELINCDECEKGFRYVKRAI